MLCVLILIGALAGGRTDILSCHRLRLNNCPVHPLFGSSRIATSLALTWPQLDAHVRHEA